MVKKKVQGKVTLAVVPCHRKELDRLRRVKGQVEGVERMINDGRYCPDIITQIRAARAALKSLEASVLETHFGHCIDEAAKDGSDANRKKKIREIMALFIKS